MEMSSRPPSANLDRPTLRRDASDWHIETVGDPDPGSVSSSWITVRKGRPKPYMARFAADGARVRSKSFERKRDAEVWIASQTTAMARGEWVDPRRGNLTLEEWSERWLAGRRVRPSTMARDESYLRSLILPYLGPRSLNRLAPEEFRVWILELEKAGKAPATIRKAWQLVGQLVDQAVEDGRIARSPLPKQPGIAPAARDDMKVLTPAQIDQLAEAIDHRYRAMVITAAYTGLRWGETAGLRLEDLDLLRGQIRVSHTLTEVSGEVRLGPPKTKRSARAVSISRTLAQELGQHIGRYPDSGGWVFPAPAGGPIRATNWRRRIWAPAVARAGLEPLRFHDLRHTHASLLIAQGEHPKVIAERLGHSSITVTFDVYGHLMPGIDDQVAERLDRVMRADRA